MAPARRNFMFPCLFNLLFPGVESEKRKECESKEQTHWETLITNIYEPALESWDEVILMTVSF